MDENMITARVLEFLLEQRFHSKAEMARALGMQQRTLEKVFARLDAAKGATIALSKALGYNLISHPRLFEGEMPFKYRAIENRLPKRWSSLFSVALLVYLYFSHVPGLFPSNTIFIRFNIASPLLFLLYDCESRQKTYIKIKSCHFI